MMLGLHMAAIQSDVLKPKRKKVIFVMQKKVMES
jgi:hypothetical protein